MVKCPEYTEIVLLLRRLIPLLLILQAKITQLNVNAIGFEVKAYKDILAFS